jgi:hypothetical protein
MYGNQPMGDKIGTSTPTRAFFTHIGVIAHKRRGKRLDKSWVNNRRIDGGEVNRHLYEHRQWVL